MWNPPWKYSLWGAGDILLGCRNMVSLPSGGNINTTSGRNRVKLFFWGGGGPYPDADKGFPEGGGWVKTLTSTPPPPLDIVRVTSSALRKIEKHPHYNVLL